MYYSNIHIFVYIYIYIYEIFLISCSKKLFAISEKGQPTYLKLKSLDVYSFIVLSRLLIAYPFQGKRYTISKMIKIVVSLRNAFLKRKKWPFLNMGTVKLSIV